MFVLDTDMVSILQSAMGPIFQRLRDRIQASGETAFTTIVTFQEQMRGRLAQCAKANDPEKYVLAARQLHQTFEDYRDRNILDFDELAATEFRRLRGLKIRIGTMDLRIAAITLGRGVRLISRNVADFKKVPGLRVEDW